MAWYLFWWGSHILLALCLASSLSRWQLQTESFLFPEFSCSSCHTSTSCLVALPVLYALLLASVYLKYNWQGTDHRPTATCQNEQFIFTACLLLPHRKIYVINTYLTQIGKHVFNSSNINHSLLKDKIKPKVITNSPTASSSGRCVCF